MVFRNKKRFWRVTIFFFLLGAIVFSSSYWLPWPCRFLTVNDNISSADVILSLSGALPTRFPEAVRLYKQQKAPRIITSRNDLESSIILMVYGEIGPERMLKTLCQRFGITTEAVTLLPFASSTWEEAHHFLDYAKKNRLESAIIVTSHSHSRRVKLVFDYVFSASDIEISVVEAENGFYSSENWWQVERGLILVFNEYIKLGYYLGRYFKFGMNLLNAPMIAKGSRE